ncbi:U4/U6 small nuclear ribonucleoprotein PRP31 [Babesia microti strain RI]|uniref:U4/U6 small nuclear ribonucleoprotein PRP31 n=1 Tax=Babesia microti (strain RI) TaxID=1133968 RepID=A0A1R4AAJ9_BABMR|nr:U4/U6 small nuclear ribonucleoprotein PRP31 [Babesia microti strain RI]SJK86023.1 U4/U6 small nuclear ribonucleoprotein PRP31 [Babesia microti strain RI]|eukprot:XP_021338221.1 U4/U6 small nuclear ribonucleoprotein PRP31 [Babesia microti strain RI]
MTGEQYMATLADSFLLDLEDLEHDDEIEDNNNRTALAQCYESDPDETIKDAVKEYFSSSDLKNRSFSQFLRSERLNKTIEKIIPLLDGKILIDREVDYKEQLLIRDCNSLVIEIDTEILSIHKYVKDIYCSKFPELESIVVAPLDYISLVKRIQNESDITKIDMKDILPNATAMAVTVAATMTMGSALGPYELSKLIGACDDALKLAAHRNNVLLYLESRMTILAPNISRIIGSALTARLITMAGGLQELAKIPSQNIMLIGDSKNTLFTGHTFKGSETSGVISCCEIVQTAVSHLKFKAIKMVSSKVALAARVDLFGKAKDGGIGEKFRNHILVNLSKALEMPDAPIKKALPIPEERKTNKRGGKRYRKMKEKYGISQIRQQANRIAFGPEGQEEIGLEGHQLGMLGKSTGKGKIILQVKRKQIHVPRKRQLMLQKQMESSNAINGMATSLAFTPLQGIELCNPKRNTQEITPGYFDKFAKFSKLSMK